MASEYMTMSAMIEMILRTENSDDSKLDSAHPSVSVIHWASRLSENF